MPAVGGHSWQTTTAAHKEGNLFAEGLLAVESAVAADAELVAGPGVEPAAELPGGMLSDGSQHSAGQAAAAHNLSTLCRLIGMPLCMCFMGNGQWAMIYDAANKQITVAQLAASKTA